MASARISASVALGGETATISVTKTKDGVVTLTPEPPLAVAGTLTTRLGDTSGTITVASHTLVNTNKVVLTWEDEWGVLKRAYNGTVGAGVTGTTIPITGLEGDVLPAVASAFDIAVGLQVEAACSVDWDEMEAFVASTNVRGVIILREADDDVQLVIDPGAHGGCLWLASSGITSPITGDPTTKVQVGSGNTTTAFRPKILFLYDASPNWSESGQ